LSSQAQKVKISLRQEESSGGFFSNTIPEKQEMSSVANNERIHNRKRQEERARTMVKSLGQQV
jgi:hypothetical protein